MAREEDATNPAPNPLCHVTGCRAKPADVYFVLDTASGTSDAAVQQQQQFLASLAALFPLSKTAVRVGIISFGHRPEVTARLGRKDKMADLQQAVHSTPRVGGLLDIAQVNCQHLAVTRVVTRMNGAGITYTCSYLRTRVLLCVYVL